MKAKARAPGTQATKHTKHLSHAVVSERFCISLYFEDVRSD